MPVELPSADFFGHTIFCDDIRYEIGGKVTYVGAYYGAMYVNTDFPVKLPKFAFSVGFSQRREKFEPSFAAWIFFPGDPDDKPSMIAEMPKVTPPSSGEYVTTRANFVLSDVQINQPGAIKVRMLRQDMLHKVGALKVERAPVSVPAGNQPPPPADASP